MCVEQKRRDQGATMEAQGASIYKVKRGRNREFAKGTKWKTLTFAMLFKVTCFDDKLNAEGSANGKRVS